MEEHAHSHFTMPTGNRLIRLSRGYCVIPVGMFNRMVRSNKISLAIITVKALLILFLSLTHRGIHCA